jgi:predicted flap endonuclease-1-like 5' DNA nuclease
MSTWAIILALLGSMTLGVLLTILYDTAHVRRWREDTQADKGRLEDQLRQRTIQVGRTQANAEDLSKKLRAYQRELDEEQKETMRLDELRVELETKLETAVADTQTLKAELKQFDDEMDDLRDEKVELARQLTVAQVEMKYMAEDLEESRQKLAVLDELEAENQKLTTTLEIVEKERDERKAKVEELLNQIAETERLRANLKETEEKLQTSNSQLGNMQTALGRAKSQIKHTGKSQLQLIKGIGPATERKLKAAGIVTVADLATETPERLREILGPKSAARAKPEAWLAEAQQLAPTFGEETPSIAAAERLD